MTSSLRLAFTADLHWGARGRGDDATRLLISHLHDQPPDVLVLAGDVGAGDEFERCLELFDKLSCRKALVPGNHDIWVTETDARGDSRQVYHEHLPRLCAAHGFHYLDQAHMMFPDADVALVGSINWYDYSWSLDRLKQQLPDYEERLRSKRFARGRHNDARFVRWPTDDVRFTAEVVAVLARHLEAALTRVGQAIVVTHHPPCTGLSFPRSAEVPLDTDALLWEAFGGNRSAETLLTKYAARIPFAFCGHPHRARHMELDGLRGYNIGGDYHFKRLLVLDWPAGTIHEHVFGDPQF